MFNKNSNKTLWIIFAVLLVAVVIIFSSESTKQERSFKTDLVDVDTSSITSISIFPKSKPGSEVKLLKDNSTWSVISETGKSYTVPSFKVKNILGEVTRIKPKRVAARNKSKWKEYEVDSVATRVVLFESGSEVLNLIIGKFAFQQPRSMSTFIRLMNENDVYEVDGFLDMIFNKDVNSFRDETVIKSNKDSWNKIVFTSNDSDNFELIKVDEKWTIDGIITDSAKTENALSSLARVNSTDYADNVDPSLLPTQVGKVVIEIEDDENIEIISYQNNDKFVIQSSLNKENIFDGSKIAEKLFLKKDTFF